MILILNYTQQKKIDEMISDGMSFKSNALLYNNNRTHISQCRQRRNMNVGTKRATTGWYEIKIIIDPTVQNG